MRQIEIMEQVDLLRSKVLSLQEQGAITLPDYYVQGQVQYNQQSTQQQTANGGLLTFAMSTTEGSSSSLSVSCPLPACMHGRQTG